MTINIPIGVDCSVAWFFKQNKLRTLAFPFDWNVSYNGVSQCIEDNFKSFIPEKNKRINNYDIYFHHDFNGNFDNDKNKYIRRTQRFKDLLETTNEEIVFCRRGHMCHHHSEHNGNYNIITNDIDDIEKLNIVISNKYPNLKYKIILLISCVKCFDVNKIYKSDSDKIKIYNNSNFDKCMREIFNVE